MNQWLVSDGAALLIPSKRPGRVAYQICACIHRAVAVIDRSFVCSHGAAADIRAIIQTVLGIGKTLNVAVTAEGVETEDPRQFRCAGRS